MKYRDIADRLLSNSWPEDNGYEIDGQPSECWVWLGNLDCKGYGRISMRVNGRATGVRAHRASFEHFHATKLKEGVTLDHKCRVPRCIHPNHLEPMARGRQHPTDAALLGPAQRRGSRSTGLELCVNAISSGTLSNA